MFGLARLLGKAPPQGGHHANLWMVSYADMATLLLAMFIALSCLSKDQTGLGYEKGLDGFRGHKSLKNKGSLSDRSSRVVGLPTTGPLHPYDDPGSPSATDPDARSIDAEEECLQRFLHEMRSRFKLTRSAPVRARVAVDFYLPLEQRGALLSSASQDKVLPLLALARQHDCRIEVIVWALTPNERLCAQATLKAQRLAEELAEQSGYDGLMRSRMTAVGQPWRYRDVRRPVFSLALRKQGGITRPDRQDNAGERGKEARGREQTADR